MSEKRNAENSNIPVANLYTNDNFCSSKTNIIVQCMSYFHLATYKRRVIKFFYLTYLWKITNNLVAAISGTFFVPEPRNVLCFGTGSVIPNLPTFAITQMMYLHVSKICFGHCGPPPYKNTESPKYRLSIGQYSTILLI